MLDNKAEAQTQYSRVAGMTQAGEFASLAKAGLGRIAQENGNLEQARSLYEEARALTTTPETRTAVEQLLGRLNLHALLIPREGPYKEAYLIQPGDSMVGIALAQNSTVELLCRINNIENPAQVRPKMRILLPRTDFSILIDKSDFKLTLFNHDKFFKSYRVGLGKHGSTPVGEFIIDNKITNPTWWSPDHGPIPPGDPRNELSTRWMGLKPLTPGIGDDYGIHGTIDPSTVGWESSNGCPRMFTEESEELFMLVTEGTPVEIQE
jgi:lipoprotein-anchoring transpeptidase ErfK/SrfK